MAWAPSRAIESLRSATEMDSSITKRLFVLARLYEGLEELNWLSGATAALDLHPHWSEGWFRMGLTFRALGRHTEARAALGRAVCLGERKGAFLFECARSARTLGDLEDARDLLLRANDLERRNLEFRQELAEVLRDLGRHAEAASWFKKALAMAPKRADLHHEMGKALYASGRVDEAREALSSSLKLEPEDPRSLETMGVVEASMGLLPQAIECFRRSVRLDPRSCSLPSLGRLCALKGLFSEACQSLRQALDLESDPRPFPTCSMNWPVPCRP